MSNRNTSQTLRYRRILDLIAEEPLSASQISERLTPSVSPRQIREDLAYLQSRFPDQIVREHGGDARNVFWTLKGLPPIPFQESIDYLTHDELAALIAARGFLRAPDAKHPGWERPTTPYEGDLSAALHGLLERAGLGDEARAIAPATIGVSRFAVAPEPSGALAAIERALLTGQAVRFHYRNRTGAEREVYAMPLRLVSIKGEWHLFAWSPATDALAPGRVKQYRLSRLITADPVVTVVSRPPPGCPQRAPRDDVDRMLASGFNATSSTDPAARKRLVIAIGPEAWPEVVDRTWGDNQTISAAPERGIGWQRLAFSTSGWQEARGWILSLGANARAEGPPELVTWLHTQIKRMESDLTQIAEVNTSNIGDIGCSS